MSFYGLECQKDFNEYHLTESASAGHTPPLPAPHKILTQNQLHERVLRFNTWGPTTLTLTLTYGENVTLQIKSIKNHLWFWLTLAFFYTYFFTFGIADGTLVISDMKKYMDIAQDLDIAQTYWPIGYPLILRVLFELFGASATAAIYLNVAMHFTATTLLSRLTLKIYGQLPAIICIIVYGLNRGHAYMVNTLVAENPLALFIVLSIYLTHKIVTTGSGYKRLGLTCGFAMLVKANFAWVLTPIIGISLLAKGWQRKNLVATLLFLITAICIPITYGFYTLSTHGRFVPFSTNGPVLFWMSNNPNATGLTMGNFENFGGVHGVDVEARYLQESLKYRKSNPKHISRLTERRLKHFWVSKTAAGGEMYKSLETDHNFKGNKFLSTKWFPFIGAIAIFCIPLVGLLEKKSSFKKRDITLIASALALGAIVCLVAVFTAKNHSYKLSYALLLAAGLASLLWPLVRRTQSTLTYFLASIPIGFHISTGVFAFFFMVKIRYRVPTNTQYALAAALTWSIAALVKYMLPSIKKRIGMS